MLINGRRIAPFSSGSGTGGVNINNIPLAGIERVEVLKDGASALYGADAIAGVINFIMASNYQGAEADMYASTPTRSGGGQTYRPSAVMGFGDIAKDRFNLTVTAQYENQQALFAKDRSFAETGNVSPWIVAGATGQGNIEGAYNLGTGSVATATGWKARAWPGSARARVPATATRWRPRTSANRSTCTRTSRTRARARRIALTTARPPPI